ncbi:hypothetical protein SDC9_146145 [bioreactor metagenome]|uniref:Uncharacterized protein n=1 Tax=bioreactor metagenome TaxID=1076179 RepID=A0A645EBU3_9ZZZZ
MPHRAQVGGVVRRSNPACGHRHSQPGGLRIVDRRAKRRLPLARVRREHRIQPVLHQRHHRQPQGRALQPPLHRAARLCGGAAGRDGHFGPRRRAARGAHVPCERVGHAIYGGADRRQGGVPRPGAGRQVGLRADRGRGRDLCRRRAHRLADAARLYEARRPAFFQAQPHGDRRLRLPASHDHGLPG